MSLVNIVNMVVLDNPTLFGNPFQFEITFECLEPLEDDLEFKIVYVGSAESSTHDQTLDEVLVGPVPVGTNKFVLQADAPDTSKIPDCDILGVTVVLVTCSYRDNEFARIGYYVNNEYTEAFDPEVGPPKPTDLSKVMKAVLADKPRVTRFPIDWREGDEIKRVQEQVMTTEQFIATEVKENSASNLVEDSDMELEERGLKLAAGGAVVSPMPEEVEEDDMIMA